MTFQSNPEKSGGMSETGFTTKNVIILIVLLIVCTPVGVLFLCWIMFGKKGLLTCCGCLSLPFLLFCLWLGLVMYIDRNPEFGEHVSHVSWISDTATDVSFYKSYSYTAYEFKISEKDFRKGANSSWNFQEIVEPETIQRYNSRIEWKKYTASHPEYDSDAYSEIQKKTSVTVRNGIVAHHRQSNGGGYHAVYDRDTGTAYIQTSPR